MVAVKPGTLLCRIIAVMPAVFLLGAFAPQTVFAQQASTSQAPGQGNFDYDKYEVGTLKQIIKFHESSVEDLRRTPKEYVGTQPIPADAVMLGYSADLVPTKVRVKYTGLTRKLRPDIEELLSGWVRTGMAEPKFANLFKSEMLFIEGTDEHWLPVQSQLIPFFKKELKKGDDVGLYVVWVGWLDRKGSPDWVFLVNEFLKPGN